MDKGGDKFVMSNFRTFIFCWVLMWACTYIVVPFVAPALFDMPSMVSLEVFGWLILLAFGLYFTDACVIGQFLFLGLGFAEVLGGVASWTGTAVWNVPFPNKELFQVSMAAADLLSAVFMFWLALIVTED